MADKTIVDLQEANTFDEDSWHVFDSGIETFKIRAPNFKRAINSIVDIESAFGTINLTTSDRNKTFIIEGTPGSEVVATFNLPASNSFGVGFITIKDLSGCLNVLGSSVAAIPQLGDFLEGRLGAIYHFKADYGSWTLFCDGTKWFFI